MKPKRPAISCSQLTGYFEHRLPPLVERQSKLKPKRILRGYFRSKIGRAIKHDLDNGIYEVLICFNLLLSYYQASLQAATIGHAAAAACRFYNLTMSVLVSDYLICFIPNNNKFTINRVSNLKRNKVILLFQPAESCE